MNKLGTDKRVQILSALVEGCSINSTVRMCSVSKLTVLRLLADVGLLCQDHHDLVVRNLSCRRVQVDEIWSFVGCKQKNKEAGKQGEGDCWVWTALDADTKLVPTYLVGLRDSGHALEFIRDLADRLTEHVQLTSDGNKLYIHPIENAFGHIIDYAQLWKYFGLPEKSLSGPYRYSPPRCIGTNKVVRIGRPDPDHISTSYVERQNLTIRMGMRRFTRLTNGFSKKGANHAHAVALHYFHYNFCRVHQTLKTTPAVAAGVADHAWRIPDLVHLLEREERLRGGGGRINRADRT